MRERKAQAISVLLRRSGTRFGVRTALAVGFPAAVAFQGGFCHKPPFIEPPG
jgi:hypothetical protein